MDQFDDLPDIVEKDDRPQFQTEVHKPTDPSCFNGSNYMISNGL